MNWEAKGEADIYLRVTMKRSNLVEVFGHGVLRRKNRNSDGNYPFEYLKQARSQTSGHTRSSSNSSDLLYQFLVQDGRPFILPLA